MGIRDDRIRAKATNGPMIFFNDPLSKEGLSEEIKGAIISGLSFYCYRLPRSGMIVFGSSEGFTEEFGTPGFVIGMFNPAIPYLTIPYKGTKNNLNVNSCYKMPIASTTRKEYIDEIQKIQNSIAGITGSKIVAARVMVIPGEMDPADEFFKLSISFPDGYIFCFGTPATGCWIGASPELLLESQSGYLKSMALAGTRKAATPGPWDDKNLEEQEIVTQYIIKLMKDSGLEPESDPPHTSVTGQIEHICSHVYAKITDSTPNLEQLLRRLSPTPALCGQPRPVALDVIKETEKFDRGCYGGFCGPYNSPEDFTFNVIVRCASFDSERVCKYVGGGITAKSTAESEWLESEAKLKNFITR